MSRTFRPWSPTQSYLLPPSPTDWLPSGHLVFFLLDLIPQLDLSAIDLKYKNKDPRGAVGFDPHMMTALLLYGYSTGVASSRRLEKACHEDVAFLVLTAGQQPDHTRISEFRRQHLAELRDLFLQILRLCQKAGMVKLGHVALDGTKIQANASKHKAMSYDRLLKSEKELAEEIKTWMEQTEQVDQAEDALYGKSRRGDELPEDLQHKQRRLDRIRKAKAELEAEAAAARARELATRAEDAAKAAEASSGTPEESRKKGAADKAAEKAKAAKEKADELAKKIDRDPPDVTPTAPGDLPSHQVKSTADGAPAEGAQRNFTDPDSRIMKSGGEFVQAYNCQAAVDEGHQVIVALAVTNQPPDAEHLQPLAEQMIDNCQGARPWRFSADAGYFSQANAEFCQNADIDAYIATGRLKHGEEPPRPCGRIPKNLDAKGRMARKLRTTKGKAAYARRKATVEPVFGQIKEARGYRRFLLRGLEKVRAEWALICATHNLLKLFGVLQTA